ncbi:MAG: hypothetical protein M3O71_19770 [Bacteroidota bacterium]|nr:hypothetical protein [Bacteroidota bacterium]
MVELINDREPITQFIIEGLEKFVVEVGKPSIMGIYCCPWSGWITLNFNVTFSLEEQNYSCPDFEFVEFDIVEFQKWEEEYESDQGVWVDDSKNYEYNFDEGDEGLNSFFYSFLKNLIFSLNEKYKLPSTIVQFLDSRICERVI